jgi:hypothetical protein
VVALGHENEPVAKGQIGQSLGNAGEQLDLLLSDGAREAVNALGFLALCENLGKALFCGDFEIL